MPLRKHGAQPGGQAAASMEVTKERSFKELAVNAVGEVACAASRFQRVGGTIERRTMLANEVVPGRLVTPGASARQREVFEVQLSRVGAPFRASLERVSEPLERHTPAFGACPAIETLDERRVDRQPSHSTPGALIGDHAQQHSDREWK